MHVIEWPRDLPTSLAFAEGPSAAAHPCCARRPRDVQDGRALLDAAVERLQRAHLPTPPRNSSKAALATQ